MRNRGRTRLTFQKPVDGNDGFGPNPGAGGWGDDIDIGVLVKPTRNLEAERNGVVTALQSYECEIRSRYAFWNPGIDTTWRATDKLTGRVYNISSVQQRDDDYRWAKLVITSGEYP